MKRLFGAILTILATGVFSGCGGGSSGTGVSSGLDPERIVSTINTVEYSDLCESISQNALAEFESNKAGFCSLGGLFGAFLGDTNGATVQICEDIKAECLSAPVETEDDPTSGCPIRREGIAGCQAAVKDIEACFTSTFELMGEVLSQFQCGDSIEEFTRKAEAFGKVSSGAADVSRECAALRSKCANLLIDQA